MPSSKQNSPFTVQTDKVDALHGTTQILVASPEGNLLESNNALMNVAEMMLTSIYDLLLPLNPLRRDIEQMKAGKSLTLERVLLPQFGKRQRFTIKIAKTHNRIFCFLEKSQSEKPVHSLDEEAATYKEEIEFLKKMQELRHDYFAKIAHDIKLPLTEIIGTAYLLKKHVSSDKALDYLKALNDATRGLDNMLNELLHFARSESYRFRLELRPFSLEQTLYSLFAVFEYKSKQHDIPISLEYDSDIPRLLKGDAPRLSQILYNLLDNALKFTPKGKISVKSNLKRKKGKQCIVEFTVCDSGVGIPQESLQQIFETFKQVNELRDATRGFGIGLSIVKQLVELQGGSIVAKSQLGKGSTFVFELPYEVAE